MPPSLRSAVSRLAVLVLTFAGLFAGPAAAQLAPGDIAIVGMNADGSPDDFAFVALTDLPAGTEIHFTDNGWFASGGFRANEGTVTYTAPAFVGAGTVVPVEAAGGVNFAASGDQLLAYQGTAASPTFLFAVNNEGAGVWQSDATSSNTSALPDGLVEGFTAVALIEVDNVAYAGPTSGTRAGLLAAIADNANWAGDDAAPVAFPAGPFTVTDGGGGNAPPQFTAELDSQSIPAEEPFEFTYAATDADDLTFSLVDGPTGATLDPFTGLFEWTPSAADVDFAFTVTVSVSDGEATVQTTATLTVEGDGGDPGEPGVATDLFFSEYVEGSSFNKALELYNGTGSAVDLSGYRLELYTNGSASVSQSTTLSGTLADGDVFLAAHTSADPAILAVADLLNGSVINFNGDDAIVLRTAAGAVIDVIGQVGVDPGSQWGSGLASTADNTLRRMAASCSGDTNPSDAFDPADLYDGYAQDTFGDLGTHTATCTAAPANDAPVFADALAGDLVDDGALFSYTYVADDPDGDDVTYALASGPAGASIVATTGVLTWTASGPGVFAFVVTASDGTATTSTRTIVGVRGTLFPGEEGAALRHSLRGAYTPARTMGYNTARDTMYARIDRQPDGRVEGVYTGFSVFLPDGVDPSTYLYDNDSPRSIDAEHTWPQSMGAGDEPARSDMHNLFPTKGNVNSARSNKPFADIPDHLTSTWYRLDEASTTIPSSDIDEYAENVSWAFEPREVHKGNAARAALYFFTVYEAVADRSFLLEQKETFVDWDAYDPADVAEVVRTEGIARRQGTINPFVIDPSLAVRAVTDIVPPEPIPIAEARAEADGTVVTVEGIVTRAGGRFTRLQDASGDGATAIATFQTSGALRAAVEAGDVASGDVLRVTGTMASFNGLRQMNPSLFTVVERGVDLPEAQLVTLAKLGVNGEDYESELVRVTGLTVDTDDETFATARTYAVADGTADYGEVDLRTPSSGEGDVVGSDVPDGLFAFEGVLGEFNGTYQLQPIDATDVDALPVIEVVEAPIVVWPPDGHLVSFDVADLVVSVTDAEQGAIAPSLVRIVRVTSDEAENGDDDGNTTGDIVIGDGCTSADVRAERQGSGEGRAYTLHLAVGDGSGNVGDATVEVHVPVGRRDAVVVGPVAYEVSGTCGVEYAPIEASEALAARGSDAGKDSGAETADAEAQSTGAGLPAEFALEPAYPNPLAGRATVGYALPEAAEVRVVVYDVLGREVGVLADGPFEAGQHEAVFEASGFPSGTYLVRMTTDQGFAETQRITVLR